MPNFKEKCLIRMCLTQGKLPISKLPNFKEKCLPQNCLRQGKIPKSAYLKYFQTQLKSAYIQILHCSRLPISRYCCIPIDICCCFQDWKPRISILKSKLDQNINLTLNCILLPKLFWPTVRKNCDSDGEKVFEITRIIYSNSKWSENSL